MPPPGVPHHVARVAGFSILDEQDALVGVDDERAHGLAAARARATRFSALNQRSRSSYGTAAFAGDVDGSTKSAVEPIVRNCGPSSGRSLKRPR